jgi:ribonuclease HII
MLIAFDFAQCPDGPVFGLDEAGRGALVGPVVAACVRMNCALPIEGINDSKRVSPAKRERIAKHIREQAICYGIGLATEAEIESHNILVATKMAMARAFVAMDGGDGFLLIDAIDPSFIGQRGCGIVRGDSKSYAVAAASILAKTHRDELMRRLSDEYPGYGFEVHKGYGTKAHIDAIREMGPCPCHRPSFLKGILNGTKSE